MQNKDYPEILVKSNGPTMKDTIADFSLFTLLGSECKPIKKPRQANLSLLLSCTPSPKIQPLSWEHYVLTGTC